MIKRIFARGLIAIAPISITVAVIIWLYNLIEGAFSELIKDLIGPTYYFKGLGIIVVLVLIFVVGILINNWIVQWLYHRFEKLLHRMPLIKTLYRSITDLMSFFKGEGRMKQGSVVVVKFNGIRILGLVSRKTFKDLPEGIASEDYMAIFIPMSYQIGGVTIMVLKDQVETIDMSVEQGLRFSATAGMPAQQDKASSRKPSSEKDNKEESGKDDAANKDKY